MDQVIITNTLAIAAGDAAVMTDSDQPWLERKYYTKAEKILMLEEYLVELKAEQAGVEEALEELRK